MLASIRNNKMKLNKAKTTIAGLLILVISSCGTFEKATTLNPETNYFPAKEKKKCTVLKEISVNADTLKILLVVPTSNYWLEMGKNLDYFESVLTYDQFQSEIVKKGLSDQIPSLAEKVGLNRAYNLYKPFVILNITKVKKTGNSWYAGLTLYDPNRADIIFQNEIWLNLMWDGWTDQGTMFPLFNSLLDYLRKQ